MRVLTLEEFREFVARGRWQFARSMPWAPHEYVTRARTGDDALWDAAVVLIQQTGVERHFGSRTFRYLVVDGRKYWTMGAPVHETIIINRWWDDDRPPPTA